MDGKLVSVWEKKIMPSLVEALYVYIVLSAVECIISKSKMHTMLTSGISIEVCLLLVACQDCTLGTL